MTNNPLVVTVIHIMATWLIGIAVYLAYRFYKSRTGGAGSQTATPSFLSPQIVVVGLNSVCVLAGLIYLTTFNSTLRFVCMTSAIVSSIYVVVTNYGLPSVSRGAIRQPLQEWFAKCMNGAEFPFLFFSLAFLNDNASQVGGVIPFGIADYASVVLIVRRSIWSLGTHGAKAWTSNGLWNRFGSRVWSFLKVKEGRVMEWVNLTEIMIGFWLIVLVLTPARQLMNVFVFWNYLRIRYMAPRSRPGHALAWSKIDAKTKSIRSAVPFLEMPIGYASRWFNQTA